MKLKITTVGNSAGVVRPTFAERMEVAEEIMRDRRDLLRRMADS